MNSMNIRARDLITRVSRKQFLAKGANPLSCWWLVNTQFSVALIIRRDRSGV